VAVDYAAVLLARHPGTEWSLTGTAYSGLVWLDASPKPTKASLDAAWPEVQHEEAIADVEMRRADRYRNESDPLYFEAARGEDGVTMADWQAKVAEIKADLPYPEAP